MASLESNHVNALSGKAKSLVVFVHGYGADGSDLISLAPSLAPMMPDTMFVAPNAPHRCTMNPMGFEWFPIPWLDGSTEERSKQVLYRSSGVFTNWLDKMIAGVGVTPSETILFGFSQGTMLSLHHGIRRDDPLAGIVGFSGRLMVPETLAQETKSKPPVLLVHGDIDAVVPPSEMPVAHQALTAAGFDVDTHMSRGMGHGIAPDGLGRALEFMKSRLSD
jgi:phospholipase/carboxylesterase